jgi:hypothetical protein
VRFVATYHGSRCVDPTRATHISSPSVFLGCIECLVTTTVHLRSQEYGLSRDLKYETVLGNMVVMRYTALNTALAQIRLLHLRPAANYADIIECYMSVASVDDPSVQYDALSYFWGDRDNDQTIQLEGSPWKVTANLF